MDSPSDTENRPLLSPSPMSVEAKEESDGLQEAQEDRTETHLEHKHRENELGVNTKTTPLAAATSESPHDILSAPTSTPSSALLSFLSLLSSLTVLIPTSPACTPAQLFILFLSTFFSFSFISLVIAFFLAPVLTVMTMTCLVLAILFVCTESGGVGIWHHNFESENRFWIGITMLFTASLLFAPDSPLAFGFTYPLFSFILVLISAAITNQVDRHLNRTSLTRTKHLRRVRSELLSDASLAQSKLAEVNSSMRQLDYTNGAYVLFKAIHASQIMALESKIIEVFESSNEEELNYIVTNVDLPLLFYKVKDKDVMVWSRSPSLLSRTRLIHMLCVTRITCLHTSARVAIIDALMNIRLKAHVQSEYWVSNVILNTNGRSLTRLKSACDAKGTATNLYKLLFVDMANIKLRDEILAHIAKQAEILKEEEKGRVTRRKIISDVDDTLFSSGGRFPGGIDTHYPHRAVYPGVLTFYRELDLGVDSETGEWPEFRLGNLVFLSARPHIYKDKTEARSYSYFEELREAKHTSTLLHCIPTLLTGTLEAGWRMVRGDYHPLAAVKVSKFYQFTQCYPEFTYVFIGDNGQADVIAALKVKEQLGKRLEAMFIHQVQPVNLTPGYTTESEAAKWKELNLHFFVTYISAATEAAKLRLINPKGLIRVIEQAMMTFSEVKIMLSSQERVERAKEIDKDIEVANRYLTSLEFQSMPLISPTLLLDPPQTPISLGITSSPVSSPRRYSSLRAPSPSRYSPANIALSISSLTPSWLRLPSSLASALNSSSVDSINVGAAVSCEYGDGRVLEIRRTDQIHIIRLLSWPLNIFSATSISTNPSLTVLSSLMALSKSNSASSLPTPSSLYAHVYITAQTLIPLLACTGDNVHTPVGIGRIIRYRREFKQYEIQLSDSEKEKGVIKLFSVEELSCAEKK